MRLLRPASFFLSLCIHAGVIAFAFFLPQSSSPILDLNAPVIDVDIIYTIGKPGKAPTAKAPAEPVAPPSAPERPQAPPETQPTPPPPPPASTKPDPVPTKPDPVPASVPEPEPVSIPKPDTPKPKPATETPKPTTPAKPSTTTTPAKPSTSTTPAKPQRSEADILAQAFGDLKNKASAADNTDTGFGDPGDGIGIMGSYMQSLVSRIKPHWEYVGRADRRNPTATVRITIAADGTITDVVLATPSGDAAFDGSVLKAVRDTVRVEPPPTADLRSVLVPFAYEDVRR